MKDIEIWNFAAERLMRDESLMLLVVAKSSGSSPGRPGFKMIVAAGGEMAGSIGGGVMEIALVEQAKLRITNYELRIKTSIIEQVHRKNSANSSGMICSGAQTIIFRRMDFSDAETVSRIVAALENDEPKILQISDSDFKIAANRADEFDFRFTQTNETKFIYEENLAFKNKLCIVGGGHCALALSELMSKMESFHISLFDDRSDLNTLAKNAFAHRKIIVDSYENIGDFIDSGANVYVVVMTLGYKFDQIVVRKLLDKNFKYFGVLGSRAKMATLLRELRAEGFDAKKLAQIRTPIGLAINSQTPVEIAVSIAAEIIAVKNGAPQIE